VTSCSTRRTLLLPEATSCSTRRTLLLPEATCCSGWGCSLPWRGLDEKRHVAARCPDGMVGRVGGAVWEGVRAGSSVRRKRATRRAAAVRPPRERGIPPAWRC
jgi:hypothetical protein